MKGKVPNCTKRPAVVGARLRFFDARRLRAGPCEHDDGIRRNHWIERNAERYREDNRERRIRLEENDRPAFVAETASALGLQAAEVPADEPSLRKQIIAETP